MPNLPQNSGIAQWSRGRPSTATIPSAPDSKTPFNRPTDASVQSRKAPNAARSGPPTISSTIASMRQATTTAKLTDATEPASNATKKNQITHADVLKGAPASARCCTNVIETKKATETATPGQCPRTNDNT